MFDLGADERAVVQVVREFVDDEVRPVARELEHANAYPEKLLYAARRYDTGERADLEAGMAKFHCSEVAMEIALAAMRIHGGYGYSTEFDIERYFRDAPLMILGEGTNEIQRNVIAAQLVARGGLPLL